jgi:rubrerythrin
MLSKIPVQLEKVKQEDVDKEILRAAIMAELDAVNLYEQMAALARKEEIRKILLDIAREEKTHVGEFQALLLKEDPQQAEELRAGEREVREKTGT